MAGIEDHTLAWMRKLDEKLDAFRAETNAQLGVIKEELMVQGAILTRLESREVETVGLRALYERQKRQLGNLERRLTKLEGEKEP